MPGANPGPRAHYHKHRRSVMDENMIKALAKNLSMFYEHAPMKPPNADDMTPLDEWTAYLTAWVGLYEENKKMKEAINHGSEMETF